MIHGIVLHESRKGGGQMDVSVILLPRSTLQYTHHMEYSDVTSKYGSWEGRCGGANNGRTHILGCTQELRRKAAYCIDIVV